MINYKSGTFKICLFIVGVFLLGTFGYYFLEKEYSLFDSLYMTVITVATIGYGETHDLSTTGRVFTIFLIFLGIAAIALASAQITKFVVENELKKILDIKKLDKLIKALNAHMIVCGFNSSSKIVCSILKKNNIAFVLIDDDQEKINEAKDLGYLAINGYPAKDSVLLAAGILRASGLLSSMSSDSENSYLTLAAKELNPSLNVIVNAYDITNEEKIMRAGADLVFFPKKIGIEHISSLIASKIDSSKGAMEENENLTDIMGYTLIYYEYFGDNETTVGSLIGALGASEAISFSSKVETCENPNLSRKVSKNDSLVLLFEHEKIRELELKRIEYIKWKPEFSVGILALDEDHKKIIFLINKLLKAMNTGKGREIIASIFDSLFEYTCYHFNHEEKYFKKFNYPYLDEHVKEHKELIDQVMKLNKNKGAMLSSNICEFLLSWIGNHIMGPDMKYKEFLTKNFERDKLIL